MDMDDIISEFKGFNGKIELYADNVKIIHKKQTVIIPIGQISRVQFKRGGMEQGFLQIAKIGEEKFFYSLKDIIHDENSITFGYPKNDEAEQFKYQLERLIPDKPINMIQKIKKIQQFNPKTTNAVIATSIPPKTITEQLKESGKVACKNQNGFKENAETNSACCPKCQSTSIQASTRGYSLPSLP